MRPIRNVPTADLGLVLVAAIWGVNFSVMKLVLDELDPLALNALRFPMAAAALYLAVPKGGRGRLPASVDAPRLIALGLVGNVVYQLCFVFGIDWTYAGNASLLLATTPVWTVLLSAAVGHERLSGAVLGGVAATLVGIGMIVVGRGEPLSLGSETLRGDLLMIAAAVIWSAYTVGGRTPIGEYGPLRVTAWTLWVGTPVLVVMGLPAVGRTDLAAVPAATWVGVIYAGVLSVGLAYLLWYRGVQQLGNTRTAAYSNLVPVAALATAWLWLGERPTGAQIVGAVVILAGLSVTRMARRA